MATIVTSYLEQDKQALIAGDEQAEWLTKVEKLGLAGQSALVADKKSPNPFKRIVRGDLQVIKEFCPEKMLVEKYDKEVLPLEVLSLVMLAKHENYFKEMHVYFNPNKPDPFIVGTTEGDETHLIAQWGPEKLSWDELVERARAIWKSEAKEKLEYAISKAQSQLASLDAIATEHFKGGWVSLVS